MKLSAPLVLGLSLLCTAAVAQKKSAAPAAPPPAAATAPAKPGAAGGAMKPGLWEITTVNETAGSTAKRTVTARACYGPADVTNVGRVVPQQRDFTMKCESRDPKQQGFDVTWRVACSGKDSTMSGVGKMSLSPESYTGHAELELKPASGKAAKVDQKITGTWMGPCK